MKDKKQEKDDLEGIGEIFYGIGFEEALLILVYALLPLLIRFIGEII